MVEPAHAADLRHACALGRRRLHAVVLPVQAGDTERLAGPPVPDRVVEQPAALHRTDDGGEHLAGERGGERLRRAQGIPLVGIPALEERVGFHKLREVGVVACLGREIHHVQRVFQAHAALDADAAVAAGGAHPNVRREAREIRAGDDLALGTASLFCGRRYVTLFFTSFIHRA